MGIKWDITYWEQEQFNKEIYLSAGWAAWVQPRQASLLSVGSFQLWLHLRWLAPAWAGEGTPWQGTAGENHAVFPGYSL